MTCWWQHMRFPTDAVVTDNDKEFVGIKDLSCRTGCAEAECLVPAVLSVPEDES